MTMRPPVCGTVNVPPLKIKLPSSNVKGGVTPLVGDVPFAGNSARTLGVMRALLIPYPFPDCSGMT